jgi:hypothetical protein
VPDLETNLRHAASIVAVLTIVGAPAVASADEEAKGARCEGIHSVFSPLPDECLGVIDTDRPHQTDTPHVVAAGHVQLESALVAVQLGGTLGAPPGERAAHVLFLENAYKVGVVSRVDLQVIVKHLEYVPQTHERGPAGPLNLRAKFNVIEGEGVIPAVTFVPTLFVPLSVSQTRRGGPLVFWGWELGRRFELEVNTGVLFQAKPKPATAVVLASALTYTMVDEFRVFVDIFAAGPDVSFGTGALWAFTRDLQIDLGTYVGVHGDVPVATPFLGFSARK